MDNKDSKNKVVVVDLNKVMDCLEARLKAASGLGEPMPSEPGMTLTEWAIRQTHADLPEVIPEEVLFSVEMAMLRACTAVGDFSMIVLQGEGETFSAMDDTVPEGATFQ